MTAANRLHLVTPITRGVRLASFFWLQARFATPGRVSAIQGVAGRMERSDPQTLRLTRVYHKLVRYWAEL
jgi:PKHD-type hydroxylase